MSSAQDAKGKNDGKALERTAHLFGDWELVGAGIACPFIVARLGGYDEDV
jgi:hypothetical protein